MPADYNQDVPTMTNGSQVAIADFFAPYPARRYKKGHVILVAGEPADHAYYLVEGKVKVYDVTYRGDEVVVNSMRSPVIFPLSAVINRTAPRYTFEADSDILVKQAPIADVSTFLDAHPMIVRDVLSALYRLMEGAFKRLVYSTTSSAKTRLVYALVMEAHQFGTKQTDGSYRLDATEKDLASKAGLSRETVSREARTLKNSHLLEIHHSFLIVPDLAMLEHYLDAHS
jgi:CRP/FNR family transcriptional regulator